jgi:hypothetical protein
VEGDESVRWTGPWARFFYRISKARCEPTPLWRELPPRDWLLEHVGNGHWMPPAVWLVSRTLTEKAGLWDEGLSLDDDGEYACRLVTNSSKVVFVADSSCYYRVANAASLSHYRTRAALESLLRAAMLKTFHALENENTPEMRNACGKCLSWVANFLELKAPDLASHAEKRLQELGGVPSAMAVSAKHAFIRAVIGAERASRLKQGAWKARCSVSCRLDKLLYSFQAKCARRRRADAVFLQAAGTAEDCADYCDPRSTERYAAGEPGPHGLS